MFRIERSTDGNLWQPIGTLPSKTEALADENYSYYDNNPQDETSYYRVQAVETDAATNIASITHSAKIGSVALTPDPVHTQGMVSINASVTSNAMLKVYAADGRVVLQRQAYLAKGLNQININVSTLAKGMYYLTVELKDGTKRNIPFVKE